MPNIRVSRTSRAVERCQYPPQKERRRGGERGGGGGGGGDKNKQLSPQKAQETLIAQRLTHRQTQKSHKNPKSETAVYKQKTCRAREKKNLNKGRGISEFVFSVTV